MKTQKKKKTNPNFLGPKIKTKIKLKNKIRKKLISVFRKTADLALKERIQMVLLRSEEKTLPEIAEIVHKKKSAVIFWIKRYKEYRLKGLKPRYQGGNRRLLTEEQLKEIKLFLNKTSKTDLKKLTSKALRLHIKTKYQVEYRSNESINQIFYKCGFSFRKPEQCYREASDKEQLEWLKMIKKK